MRYEDLDQNQVWDELLSEGQLKETLDVDHRITGPAVDEPGTFFKKPGVLAKQIRKRVILKNGDCNLQLRNVHHRRRRYLADIFTTLIDIQWRWTFLVFALSFLLSWLGFSVIWYIICYVHGDLEDGHLPHQQEANNFKPCVVNINDFASIFLFSIETQTTIGYGSRNTTEECPIGIILMCLQSILGLMIQALMVGTVFAKLSRPKKRAETLVFSRNAVICQRDGEMCLMFRVGDMRKSRIVEAHVRAQLIRKRVTKEGEIIPYSITELRIGTDCGEDRIFFIWPITVVHKIDEESPLYNISANDLQKERFEVIVCVEGVVESSGSSTQARTSYLPNEILWGHRFQKLVTFREETGHFSIDFINFNETHIVNTPLCSAQQLAECEDTEPQTYAETNSETSSLKMVNEVASSEKDEESAL